LQWKPSSHRLSRIVHLNYLLLPPRSVLKRDLDRISPCILRIKNILFELLSSHPLTCWRLLFVFHQQPFICWTLSAPLIFKAISFVRWVVTHSLADSNFQGHCPDVLMKQHFLWFLIISVQYGTFKTKLSVHPASPELLTN